MIIYTYSGTYTGFLSTVFEIYSQRRLPDNIIVKGNEYQCGLETETIFVEDNNSSFERVRDSIIKYIGKEGERNILAAFRSGQSDKDIVIFRFMRLMYQNGSAVTEMRYDKSVIAFEECVKRVTYEIHRLKGFLRFSGTSNGVLYAVYEPDNDITSYLLPYFAERNNTDSFIIHDKRRGIVGMYNGIESVIVHSDAEPDIVYSEAEAVFRTLWQQYFGTVTIAERKNARLQDNFLPRRYRKNMTETQSKFL